MLATTIIVITALLLIPASKAEIAQAKHALVQARLAHLVEKHGRVGEVGGESGSRKVMTR